MVTFTLMFRQRELCKLFIHCPNKAIFNHSSFRWKIFKLLFPPARMTLIISLLCFALNQKPLWCFNLCGKQFWFYVVPTKKHHAQSADITLLVFDVKQPLTPCEPKYIFGFLINPKCKIDAKGWIFQIFEWLSIVLLKAPSTVIWQLHKWEAFNQNILKTQNVLQLRMTHLCKTRELVMVSDFTFWISASYWQFKISWSAGYRFSSSVCRDAFSNGEITMWLWFANPIYFYKYLAWKRSNEK